MAILITVRIAVVVEAMSEKPKPVSSAFDTASSPFDHIVELSSSINVLQSVRYTAYSISVGLAAISGETGAVSLLRASLFSR